MKLLLDTPYGFDTYKAFLDSALGRLPKQPELMELIKCLYKLPSTILRMSIDMVTLSDSGSRNEVDATRARASKATYEISLITQKRLKAFINDAFLDSKEEFNSLVDFAAQLLHESVQANPALIHDNSEFQVAANFALYPVEFHALISDACLRMTIYDLALRKCKKLEVRLHALTTICNELLEVWKKRSMKRDDPLLRCIALFIRTSGLVEYILGPHSHFQLIQKASNVVGFLIVMGDFDRHFVEVVWQPIIVVKDQREVHATIGLLQELCHNMSLGNHYDSCAVLCEAPVNAWDETLMTYIDRVFAEIKQHAQAHSLLVEPAPYNLLIRLFSLSLDIAVSKPSATSTNFLASRFDWLYNHLGELLLYGPQIKDKKDVISQRVAAMEQGASYHATDLYILNAVLESFPMEGASNGLDGFETSIGQEIVDIDLISLLVKQTILCIESQVAFDSLYQDLQPIFKLLRLVMFHTPELIDDEHASQLWLFLCGENSRDPRVRNCSFGFFSEFLSQPSSIESNKFLSTLFKEYFAEMRPELFVPSSLDFCKNAIVYFNQHLEINDDLELLQIDGIGQVWRIITTAPEDTVANDAINYLVHFFADSEIPSYTGSNLLTKINCDLVNISIKELVEAATSLQEGIESTEADPVVVKESALKLRRSLLVLQELLEISPASGRITQKAESFEYPCVEEEPIELWTIQFQGHAPKYTAAKCDITVPPTTLGKDFYAHISLVTGLQNFRVFSIGRELFLAESELSLREIGLHNESFLMLQSRTTPINRPGITTHEAVRAEVLKHFMDLCQLLTLPDEYSEKIWELIARFPPPTDLYAEIKDGLLATPNESASHHPFKLLYELSIVRATLFGTPRGTMNSSDIHSLTVWILNTLTSLEIPRVRWLKSGTEVAYTLLECLLLLITHIGALSKPSRPNYEMDALLPFLISLLVEFRGTATQEESKVCLRAFRSILALSTQEPIVLDILISDGRFPSIIKAYLLEDHRDYLRKEIKASISSSCTEACYIPAMLRPAIEEGERTTLDVAVYLWKSLYDLIPDTLQIASQSMMTFEAMKDVLGLIATAKPSELQPGVHFSDWCSLLMRHKCEESIDNHTQDHVISGLADIMLLCIKVSKGYSSSWTTYENLGLLIQQRFLFPPLSSNRLDDPDSMELVESQDPIVLTSASRRLLGALVTLTIEDLVDLEITIDFLKQTLSEVSPLPNLFTIDRSRWLRSDAGHVGLRNLSNTCYLNSLLTQLFMNIPFRDFILKTGSNTSPPNPLSTLKNVFSNLQNSWQKAFEPKEFVSTIRDYDGDLIDVGIQMDVEEFYNLLCDRIESQISPAEAKKDFRDFFGGVFVQQIKSMECEHISEREESFSAIQCDIKGKKNLQESLKAYVEGETLNGDNKYSCTNCNAHVDAIKSKNRIADLPIPSRTCLKHIPNQVIFHLKRFEFDLRTMNRSKINDAFEFPTRIDMYPYTMEAINGDSKEMKVDEFELVGVLVHSGTAETGHYYSYIKDRAGKQLDGMPLWFEFNDAEVSTFDPSTIPSNCFGGPDSLTGKDGLLNHSYMKPYSAYMLFYERVSSQPQQPAVPVAIDLELRERIFSENEQALRRYCLFDPSHLEFVTKLVPRLQMLNDGVCSEEHDLEMKMLTLLLDTFEQIAIKIKDCEQTADFLAVLRQMIRSCRACCKGMLDWLRSRTDLLRNILLRCLSPKVRQEFSHLLIFALQNVEGEQSPMQDVTEEQVTPIGWVVQECLDYFEYLGFHMRAWDDYFTFLRTFAEMSADNTLLLINNGFLRKSLDVFLIEHLPRALKMQYGSLARFVEKGRKMSLSGLLDFIGTLLDATDLRNPLGDEEEEEDRPFTEDQEIPISRRELDNLRYSMKKNGLYILYRPLDINANPNAVNKILRKLVSNEPHLGLLAEVVKALYATVAVDPAHLAEPSLKAIIVFLECVRSANEIREMIRRIAQEVKTIGSHGGIEHLTFFKTAFVTRNPSFNPSFIANQVIENAKIWAPPLLTYHDEAVRTSTEAFLVEHLTGPIPKQSERIRNNQKELLRELGAQSVAWVDSKFVRSRNTMRDDSRLSNILRILEQCCETIDDSEDDQELKLKVESMWLPLTAKSVYEC
ncbi:hypothetical protein ABW19_dt0203147 [Dactylella cylindrospora]|nr:hypothetical protein ABW19_dt0203147 [Dactylella cylindrospora]